MLNGEVFAGAAKAGHDLVGNQQDVVAAADVGDRRPVFRHRRDRAARRAHHRLSDKGGDGIGALVANFLFERVGAFDSA